MSGYQEQVLATLVVNVFSAYAAYLTLACGQLNLGVAGFMAIGAYTSAILASMGLGLGLSIVSATLAAGLVGAVIAYPALRARGIYFTIATLAFSEGVSAIFVNISAVGGASGMAVVGHLPMLPMLCVGLALVGLVFFLADTFFGLCLTAIRNDPNGAEVFGVRVRRIEVVAFVVGALFAGTAGALYAHHFDYVEAQQFNVSLSTFAVLYALLGGLQTPLGPLVGATLFTVVPEFLRGADQWRYAAFGAAIVLLMAFRPEGLFTRALIHGWTKWRASTP